MSLAPDPCETLVRELLEWVGTSPRPYAETPTLGEASLRSTSGRSVAVARRRGLDRGKGSED